jgi:hypothetical protein
MRPHFSLTPAEFLALTLLVLMAALFPFDKQKSSSNGKKPNCNAGAPQVVECTGPMTVVQLDGTGSTNPVPGNLTYHWELCNDPRVTIDDPDIATPTLFVDLQGACSLTCTVYLAVRNQYGVTSCSTLITVQDSTAPTITCPPDVNVLQGDPTDPSATGSATAVDVGNPNPTISYLDDLSQGPDTILRVWSADDGCQTSSCTQTITITLPPVEDPHLDILPAKCPNTLNVTNGGAALVSLPVSLLGNDFDVTQVDIGTLAIARGAFVTAGGPSVPPTNPEFGDTSTPPGEPCGCNTFGPDGNLDLVLHFDEVELIATLDLDNEPDGAVIELVVTGLLLDGRPFTGHDCVKIINHH